MGDGWRPPLVPTLLVVLLAVASAVVWIRVASTGDSGQTDDAFRMAVIGDFGVGDRFEYEVAAAVREWVTAGPTDALVTTGDNIYENGEPEDFETAWHRPYGWVEEEGVELVASLGNHDIRHNDGKDVMELLDMPDRWYTTRVGAAELIVLDANTPNDAEQQRWLEEVLAGPDAPWRVAVFHQPAYSCAGHGGTQDVVENWLPVFRSGGVDLVLSGHDHTYQRFRDETTTYVVAGASGAELYELSPCDGGEPEQVAARDDIHSFVTVEGDAGRLRLTALDPGGAVLDQAELTANR